MLGGTDNLSWAFSTRALIPFLGLQPRVLITSERPLLPLLLQEGRVSTQQFGEGDTDAETTAV